MDAWHGIAWHHVAMFFRPFGSGEAGWENFGGQVGAWEPEKGRPSGGQGQG